MAYNQELLDCPVCLQLLEDPVTTSCGHSYCMKCINDFWDSNNEDSREFSCPQCRHLFFPRPVLKSNILLNNLLEEHKRTTAQITAAAEPGDVQCDVCRPTGRKRKACMFCLTCLASYCETHLRPHFEMPQLKMHHLSQASEGIRDSVCVRHNRLLEIHCRTDQQFICLLCMSDGHKGHDTVALAEVKSEMQGQLDGKKRVIGIRLLNSERKIAELKQAADSIRDAAWEVCDDFERQCVAHIRYIARKRCLEMREKAGEAEKAGVDWTNGHLGRLQHEVFQLRRKEDELDRLLLTEDPIQFLQGCRQGIEDLPVFPDACDRPGMVTEFVAGLKEKLENMCTKEKDKLSGSETWVSPWPLSWKDLISRTYLLTQYTKVEVNPDTVAVCLCLSNSNREISWSSSAQAHPDHRDRFTFSHQALCTKGLDRSHYWEVEWDGGIVDLAVSYKGIGRKGWGRDCCFGHNGLSWKLTCTPTGCTFWHNNLHKGQIPPAHSRRVGIHLDYKVGMLNFFSVSDRGFTLLHKVHTVFTEPLYPGFSVDLGSTLKLCNI